MKLILITSSIFYLLGLKLTHEVKLEKPLNKDTVGTVLQQAEKPALPEIKKESGNVTVDQEKSDSIKNCGSGENTAPYYFFIENLK